MTGLFEKYIIFKSDGTPTDTDAQYFVLRLDTDHHARIAARAYALSIMDENKKLASDLIRTVESIEKN